MCPRIRDRGADAWLHRRLANWSTRQRWPRRRARHGNLGERSALRVERIWPVSRRKQRFRGVNRAYYEMGRALVAMSIARRGNRPRFRSSARCALGYTIQRRSEDRCVLLAKSLDKMACCWTAPRKGESIIDGRPRFVGIARAWYRWQPVAARDARAVPDGRRGRGPHENATAQTLRSTGRAAVSLRRFEPVGSVSARSHPGPRRQMLNGTLRRIRVEAILEFLRDEACPEGGPVLAKSITDNVRIISPKDFRHLGWHGV